MFVNLRKKQLARNLKRLLEGSPWCGECLGEGYKWKKGSKSGTWGRMACACLSNGYCPVCGTQDYPFTLEADTFMGRASAIWTRCQACNACTPIMDDKTIDKYRKRFPLHVRMSDIVEAKAGAAT